LDVYTMRQIAHDWNDQDTVRILTSVRSAMGSINATLVLVEVLSRPFARLSFPPLPPGVSHTPPFLLIPPDYLPSRSPHPLAPSPPLYSHTPPPHSLPSAVTTPLPPLEESGFCDSRHSKQKYSVSVSVRGWRCIHALSSLLPVTLEGGGESLSNGAMREPPLSRCVMCEVCDCTGSFSSVS
jgi:hypothetical protein